MDAVAELIAGNIKPANEMMAYCVEKVRQLRTQHNEAEANMVRLKQELESTAASKLQLQGAHNQALADLRHWVEKAQEPPPQSIAVEDRKRIAKQIKKAIADKGGDETQFVAPPGNAQDQNTPAVEGEKG